MKKKCLNTIAEKDKLFFRRSERTQKRYLEFNPSKRSTKTKIIEVLGWNSDNKGSICPFWWTSREWHAIDTKFSGVRTCEDNLDVTIPSYYWTDRNNAIIKLFMVVNNEFTAGASYLMRQHLNTLILYTIFLMYRNKETEKACNLKEDVNQCRRDIRK